MKEELYQRTNSFTYLDQNRILYIAHFDDRVVNNANFDLREQCTVHTLIKGNCVHCTLCLKGMEYIDYFD